MIKTKIGKLIKIWVTSFFSIRPLLGIFTLPKYFWQYHIYKISNRNETVRFVDSYPCLSDSLSYTPFDAHYFYQAAWLARKLALANPVMHVDIGSSINMLSVLSAYQKVYFLDYRPLNSALNGLTSIAGTVTALPFLDSSIRSLSSLHVLEHIGLGRYGDPLDPNGTERACSEISRVMAPGGQLYISVPVGRERTCFNAHRIFNPVTIVKMLPSFGLLEFSLVGDDASFAQNIKMGEELELNYGCGLFVFEKL